MSFRTVLVFAAIIMVCGMTDMVEAQYRFPTDMVEAQYRFPTDMVEAQYRIPIYYRIARRFGGESQEKQEIEDNRDVKYEEWADNDCTPNGCRIVNSPNGKATKAPPVVQYTDENRTDSGQNPRPVHSKKDNDEILYPHRDSPRLTSWRMEENEGKENLSEKEAIIQQFLLKSWKDWNMRNDRGNGEEDINK